MKEKKRKKKKSEDPVSSPAKGTRAATASFRFKHPVLSMNVPDVQVSLQEGEPTEEQVNKVESCFD